MNDADLLRAIGGAVFGDLWKEPLARKLNVRPDSLDKMAKGQRPVPVGMWDDLELLLDTRETRLRVLKLRVAEHRLDLEKK